MRHTSAHSRSIDLAIKHIHMSANFLVLQERVLSKWRDTEFIYEGLEATKPESLEQARKAAQIITRDAGRTTRIIRRTEEQIEELTSADLRAIV